MMATVQINLETLFERTQRFSKSRSASMTLFREAGPGELEVGQTLRSLAWRLVDEIEDVLDTEQSQATMEDIKQHGAVPWKDVEAELRL